jgi:hypothetical protein
VPRARLRPRSRVVTPSGRRPRRRAQAGRSRGGARRGCAAWPAGSRRRSGARAGRSSSALRHATTNTAALNNIATTTVGGNQVPALLNSQRPTTPDYNHSYNNPAGGNRTLHQVGTINNTFTNNLGTYWRAP